MNWAFVQLNMEFLMCFQLPEPMLDLWETQSLHNIGPEPVKALLLYNPPILESLKIFSETFILLKCTLFQYYHCEIHRLLAFSLGFQGKKQTEAALLPGFLALRAVVGGDERGLGNSFHAPSSLGEGVPCLAASLWGKTVGCRKALSSFTSQASRQCGKALLTGQFPWEGKSPNLEQHHLLMCATHHLAWLVAGVGGHPEAPIQG